MDGDNCACTCDPKYIEKKRYIRMHMVEARHAMGTVDGKEGYNLFYPDGYSAFCPKEQFEASATLVDGELKDAIDGAVKKFIERFGTDNV